MERHRGALVGPENPNQLKPLKVIVDLNYSLNLNTLGETLK
jgi:hypothetical protein